MNLRIGFLAAAVVIGALLVGSPAQAASGITVISPKAGATLPVGERPTFKMRVRGKGVVYVHVCKSKQKDSDGLICSEEMIDKAKKGRNGIFTLKAKFFDFPEFWLNSPGTYYWQAYRIQCEGGDLDDCKQESKITRIKVG